MQLQQLLLSTVALVSVAYAAPSSLAARQVPSKPCSHNTGGVHVIAVPGEGSADPPYGLIGSLATLILQRIPGSTNVSVPYDHSQTNGVIQTQQAAATLTQYISDYHNSCPTTKIVLLGYSSGGVSTMNVLCGESSPPYNPATQPLSRATYGQWVIANIIYGDESRTHGHAYNYGTCHGQGIHPRANPDGCTRWGTTIQSYCDHRDPECCGSEGTDIEAHYQYPGKYDQAAANFVVSKFQAAGA